MKKSIDFGARIVKLHRYLLKTKHEAVLSKQILRSGTSIGANMNEAQFGNSRAEVFEEWLLDSIEYIDGIPTISLSDLIMMKQSLGREKDLADIEAIKEFIRRQNEN